MGHAATPTRKNKGHGLRLPQCENSDGRAHPFAAPLALQQVRSTVVLYDLLGSNKQSRDQIKAVITHGQTSNPTVGSAERDAEAVVGAKVDRTRNLPHRRLLVRASGKKLAVRQAQAPS